MTDRNWSEVYSVGIINRVDDSVEPPIVLVEFNGVYINNGKVEDEFSVPAENLIAAGVPLERDVCFGALIQLGQYEPTEPVKLKAIESVAQPEPEDTLASLTAEER